MTTLPQSSNSEFTTPAVRPNLLKIVSFILTVIGLGIAGYLTYTKLFSVEQVCVKEGAFNCDLVQSTVYSTLFGIPIQFIGLAGYVGIFAVLLLEGRVKFFTDRGMLIVFGMTLFGFLYSAYLTFIEAFVIHAWCMWCLGSAITMTLLFIVTLARLIQFLNRPITLDELADDVE